MDERLVDIIAVLPLEMQTKLIHKMGDMLKALDADAYARMLERYENEERFRNYLTKEEAELIVDSFVNYDGSMGAHWSDPEAVFRRVREIGGEPEVVGEFNRWALFTAINMEWSDYGGVLRNLMDGDRLFRMCHSMAVAWLTDKDRADEKGIRWWYAVD